MRESLRRLTSVGFINSPLIGSDGIYIITIICDNVKRP
jgi:GTP-sensing pleiotropic transcriptional regulator CodY